MKKRYAEHFQTSCSNNRNNFGFKWEGLLLTSVVVILLMLVVFPFGVLLANSFGIKAAGISFNIGAYVRAFTDWQTLKSIKNTLYVAASVTIIACLIGSCLAWVVTRTDIPFKRVIRLITFLAFIIPSYIMAVSWIELLGKNGFINRTLIRIFNLNQNPVDLYSLEGIIFIMTIHLYPLVFMAVSNALTNTNPALEKAAVLCGASRVRAVFNITLPLVFPSILSISLLVFSKTMSCFGVAAVIGSPKSNFILTTRIFNALNSLDLPMAVAVSMILIFFSALIFLINNRLMKNKRYTTITTESTKPKIILLGKWKIIVIIVVLLFLFFTTIIPLSTIICSSFLKRWGLSLTLKNITFSNYYNILFNEDMTARAIRNSVMYGIISATAAAFIGVVVSYISNRTKFRGRNILEFIVMWPMMIPTTVMAVAAVLAWINKPFCFYNTWKIIVVTYTAACLPFAVKNINGLMKSIDPVLEKAARISGASWTRNFKDIIIPAVIPGIRTGWILSILFALREIPISIMLYTYGTETIGVLLFNLRSDSGGLETVSAIAVIVIVLTIVGHVVINKLGKKTVGGH